MAALCNPTSESKIAWKKVQDEIWQYWSNKSSIKSRFSDKGGYDQEMSARDLKYFIESNTDMPFIPDLPLKDSLVRRIKIEIDDFNHALKGKFSNLPWIVPEGTSKQDPVARKFYLGLNEVLNYERVNVNKISNADAEIANYMIEAFMSQHGVSKKLGSTAIKKLQKLRRDMLNPDADKKTRSNFISEVEKFVNHDKEGVTIKQFIDLIHMNKTTFDEAKSKGYMNDDGKYVEYNPKVKLAVIRARKLLDDMGIVYLNGLSSIQKMVAYKYTNQDNIKLAYSTNKSAARLIDSLRSAEQSIRDSMKEGGYYPHAQMESILDIKESLSKAMNSGRSNRDVAFKGVVETILSGINQSTIPDHAKQRNPVVKEYWDKDPLFVLSEYSHQAAQFNKSAATQQKYLEALSKLRKSDTEFAKGVKRFIDEEYAVFTEGTSGRPDWANKAVLTMNAFQTARTMGLNITGAVKNSASALHFYSRVGFKTGHDARKAYDHNTDGFRDVTNKLEEEAGFLFSGGDAARELYTEGLITKKDLATREVKFDNATGKITVDNTPLRDFMAKAGDVTLDKLLFFHRITENQQRKWMFRTALHLKYKDLLGQGMQEGAARKFSNQYALKMVNGWAYEYAKHGKAKIVRGEYRTVEELKDGSKIVKKSAAGVLGAGSEITFHLLHYPLSLMESHWSSLKGAGKSLRARQGMDSEELRYMMRYAGVAGITALTSAFTNMDLFNILENETVERFGRVVDDLTEYDNPDKGTFGLLSEFTGPTIGTLKYIAIAQGLIDVDHNTFNKIIFGNVDFSDPDDRLNELYKAYQWSTEWGVIKNKLAPTIKSGRGRDLFTHFLKLYPNKWTTKWNKRIFGRSNKAKKSKKALSSTEAAIKVLEGMRA